MTDSASIRTVRHAPPACLEEVAAAADRLFLGVATVLAGLSLFAAVAGGHWGAFLGAALPALLLVAVLARLRPGTRPGRTVVALALVAQAVTLVHQSGGMSGLHFGAIVLLLALLLQYRDWLPIVAAAAALTAWQAACLAVQPSVLHPSATAASALLHMTFVATEAAVLAWMAVRLRRQLLQLGATPGMLGWPGSWPRSARYRRRLPPASGRRARWPRPWWNWVGAWPVARRRKARAPGPTRACTRRWTV